MIPAKYYRRIKRLLLIARLRELEEAFPRMKGDYFYNRRVLLKHQIYNLEKKIKNNDTT